MSVNLWLWDSAMRLSLLSKAEEAHEDSVWSCAWAGADMLLTGDLMLKFLSPAKALAANAVV